jgi:hypothetical protein
MPDLMKKILLLTLCLTACDGKKETTPSKPDNQEIIKEKKTPGNEPDRIEVQLALIAFTPQAERTKEEAKELAEQLYAQILKGADFPGIIKRYSLEKLRHPGGIGIVNQGVERLGNDFPRSYWGKRIGDEVFSLETGKFTMIPYGSKNRFGWFIIKRLK